jgi:putative hemolysin
MSLSTLVMLASLVPLIGLSAMFSATETALFSLGFADRARLRRTWPGAGRAADAVLSRPRPMLITVLLANNLVNITYFVLASVVASSTGPAAAAAIGAGSLLGLIVVGELIPKMLARAHPVRAAALLSGPFLVVFGIFGPVRRFLDSGIVAPLSRLILPRRPGGQARVSVEELGALLELAARGGAIEAGEQRLLAEIIELGTTRVREVMTPRVDMVTLDEQARAAEILDAARGSRRGWIPVVRSGPREQVLGFLDARRYLALRAVTGKDPRLADHLTPPLFVPETARLDHLLEQLRRTRGHMAMVVDELGALSGLVEIEDIVRELIRLPGDESEVGQAQLRAVGPGRWSVGGRLPVRELAAYCLGPGGASALDRRAATVGGLVIMSLGRVPRVGDVVRLGSLRLEVGAMQGRVVESVLVSAEPAPAGSAA